MNHRYHPPLLRLLALALFVLLGGCAGSTGGGPSLYVLGDQSTPEATSSTANASILVVEPVNLAAMLDESGIVYQTAAHRVVIANDNRWAAPLAGQLRDALIHELSVALPDIRVLRHASEGDTATLTPSVDAFMGHFDGAARIAGEWQVRDAAGNLRLQRSFERRAPLARDGYDALVESLAAGWRAEARALGHELSPILEHAGANTSPD